MQRGSPRLAALELPGVDAKLLPTFRTVRKSDKKSRCLGLGLKHLKSNQKPYCFEGLASLDRHKDHVKQIGCKSISQDASSGFTVPELGAPV